MPFKEERKLILMECTILICKTFKYFIFIYKNMHIMYILLSPFTSEIIFSKNMMAKGTGHAFVRQHINNC